MYCSIEIFSFKIFSSELDFRIQSRVIDDGKL